jgi:hypothetical protein
MYRVTINKILPAYISGNQLVNSGLVLLTVGRLLIFPVRQCRYAVHLRAYESESYPQYGIVSSQATVTVTAGTLASG